MRFQDSQLTQFSIGETGPLAGQGLNNCLLDSDAL